MNARAGEKIQKRVSGRFVSGQTIPRQGMQGLGLSYMKNNSTLFYQNLINIHQRFIDFIQVLQFLLVNII